MFRVVAMRRCNTIIRVACE